MFLKPMLSKRKESTMLSEKMQDALNDQLREEIFSAYLYLSMSAYSETLNLPGFAHWMRVQYDEEMIHAFKFFDFIQDRNGRVVLQALDQPQTEFVSPLDMFKQTLEHEKHISGRINQLYALAVQENDYASQTFLHWFITEQVEEEKTAGDIIETLNIIGEDGHALIMLDRELGVRTAGPAE